MQINFSADITKIDKQQHIVEGYATTSSVDRDNQVMDEEFIKQAFPKWADKFGNIRYMHQPRPVGKLINRSEWDGKGFYITAKITDSDTWSQIEDGILNGFSIGIRGGKVVPDPVAKGGRIVDGEVIETSVVDIPSNRDSDFVLKKFATYDESNGSWVGMESEFEWSKSLMDDCPDDVMEIAKRYYSQHERSDMPEDDFAGPHRTFPIKTQEDVENASRLISHAKDPEAVKRRIIEIADRKGLKIPDAWREDTKKDVSLDSGLQGHNLEGQEETKTVQDELKTTEVTDESTVEVEKTVDVESTTSTEDVKVETVEKSTDVAPAVDTQLFNLLQDISAKLDALSSQTDKDKDGDIDFPQQSEEEDDVEKADDFDPNSVEKTLSTDEIVELVKSTIASELSKFIAEQSTVTKSVVADESKTLVADVVKQFGDFKSDIEKTVGDALTRLETVEQMAAPAKGSVMAIEREIKKTSGTDAFELIQKAASQLDESAQKDLFKHVYTTQFNGGN